MKIFNKNMIAILLILLINIRLAFSQFDQWKYFNTTNGLADVEVYKIYKTSKGDLWFGTGHGATILDKRWQHFTTAEDLINYCIYAIAEDNYRNIWFGTNKGIKIFDPEINIVNDSLNLLTNIPIWCITIEQGKGIWVGTSQGAFFFNNNNYSTPDTHYTTENGLPENIVKSIMIGNQKEIWFGTANNGIAVDTIGGWKYFDYEKTGAPLNRVYEIFQARNGIIWVATIGGGVNWYDGANWEHEYAINSNVFGIEEDWENNLWFATENGIYCYS